MLAKPGTLPRPADAYAYEFKWDGYRTLLFADRGQARVQSRNLHDVTANYPELQSVARALGARRAVLDGEIVVLDARGRPDFAALQQRAGFGPGPALAAQQAPVTYFGFDLLWLDGRSLMRQPYAARRAALEGLGLEDPALWVPPAELDGEAAQAASRKLGLEGIVAKRLDSPYEPGQRSGAWVKVKNVHRQEVVVGGWTPGEGGRKGALGALLVGTYEDGALVYAGRVGTGFTAQTLTRLQPELARRARSTSPFAARHPDMPDEVRWVRPALVCEVQFTSWTRDGLLRHASFKGLRSDKDPRDVRREEVP
jgi:bifunctional non-homologous end joining protein LigD